MTESRTDARHKIWQRILIGAAGVVTTVAVISAIFQFGSRNDAPINQIPDDSAATSIADGSNYPPVEVPDAETVLKGIQSLPAELQAVVPPAISDRVEMCIESDASLPSSLGGDVTPGFTCFLPLDMGANAIVTISGTAETAAHLRAAGPGMADYLPLELAGTTGYRATVDGTSFIVAIHDEPGIFQEYSCNGVYPEEVEPCLAELQAHTGATPAEGDAPAADADAAPLDPEVEE